MGSEIKGRLGTYALVDILNNGQDGVFLFVLEKTMDICVINWIKRLKCFSRAQSFEIFGNFWHVDSLRSQQNVPKKRRL
jgi:hypothetical protein